MNDIRFYDYAFRLLHISPDVLSAYWVIKYNDIGTFEGTFAVSSEVVEIVKKHKYLCVVQGEFQAIVTAYKLDKVLTVYGKTPNWLLARKTYPAFKTSEMEDLTDLRITNVLKRISEEVFSDVPEFSCRVLKTLPKTSEHFWRNERKTVSDTVKEGLAEVSMGHRMRLDIENKLWVLEFYGGQERDVLLSEGNRNATEVSVTDDCQQYFNGCWYKKALKDLGTWNVKDAFPPRETAFYGSYYTIENEETETGKGKYPNGSYLVCVDQTGLWKVVSELPTLESQVKGDASGLYYWETVVAADSEAEAITELKKKKWEHRLDAKAVHFYYGKDYALGDCVRVQVEKGSFLETANMRITGVEVWYESGNTGEKILLSEREDI